VPKLNHSTCGFKKYTPVEPIEGVKQSVLELQGLQPQAPGSRLLTGHIFIFLPEPAADGFISALVVRMTTSDAGLDRDTAFIGIFVPKVIGGTSEVLPGAEDTPQEEVSVLAVATSRTRNKYLVSSRRSVNTQFDPPRGVTVAHLVTLEENSQKSALALV
jgi:hypothetical protein